ncbi:MAG: MFS transporter [Chloroflexi bacterium]|nr:MFS transporter [Chloroflexota bacterium]
MARPYSVLAITVLVQLSLTMGNHAIPIIIPYIQRDLGLTLTEVGLTSAAAQVGYALSIFLSGWVTDRAGPRFMMAAGQVLLAVALGLMGFSLPWLLVVFLIGVGGVGAALGNPGTTLAVVRAFSLRRRATAVGIKQTGVTIAGIGAAFGLPAISEAAGWHTAVAVLSVGVLVAAVVTYTGLPEPPADRGPKRGIAPLGTRELARNRSLWLVATFASIMVAGQYCILSYLMLYLHDGFGIPIIYAGWFLALVQFGGLIGRVGWGIVSDRLFRGGRREVLSAAAGLGAVCLLVIGLSPSGSSWVVLPLLFLLGLSVIGWHGVYQTLIPELVGPQSGGLAIGFVSTFSQIGPIAGPPLFGSIVDYFDSFRPAWIALAAATAVAAGLLTLLDEPRRSGRTTDDGGRPLATPGRHPPTTTEVARSESTLLERSR